MKKFCCHFAKLLVLIGALNWGVIGLWKYNVVESIVGQNIPIARFIYILVGLSAVVLTIMKLIKHIRKY